jgi:Tetracyclin repressor-like, C-terminal domain
MLKVGKTTVSQIADRFGEYVAAGNKWSRKLVADVWTLRENFDEIASKHPLPKERLFATSRGLIQFCTAHPQQFRNVFFGPENRNGVRAGQYIDDLGRPLFERFVQLFFDVAREEGLPNQNDTVVAHTWWYSIFGLATLMVIQGVVPDLPDQTLVVEQTIATLWAGVRAVPRLPKSSISKRSGRSSASKQ